MQLNQTELHALSGPLSNEARVLYCLYLRSNADQQNGISHTINYAHIKQFLNAKQAVIERGRQINQLLDELAKAGLVVLPPASEQQSLNGQQLTLPLIHPAQHQFQHLHMQWQTMLPDWQPDTLLYNDLCKLVGIVEKEYNQQDLGEFIAYWLSRPEANFTLFQWTQKFVQHMRKRRLAINNKPQQRIGNQMVTAQAQIKADDNAKKLVEKYRAKHQQKD